MKMQRAPDPLWSPKLKPCAKMCDTCPFQPDGSGYAVAHEDFPTIAETIERVGDFACHQTTGLKDGREPSAFGTSGQLQCAGATAYRRGESSLPEIVEHLHADRLEPETGVGYACGRCGLNILPDESHERSEYKNAYGGAGSWVHIECIRSREMEDD